MTPELFGSYETPSLSPKVSLDSTGLESDQSTIKQEGFSHRVRVTFLREEDDAKDGWEQVDENQEGQRNKKQAEEA
jgi:hypothetical protein